MGCVTLWCRLLVYCAIVTTGRIVFRRMSQTSWWCRTLHCRLLVIVGSLRLVVLVFEESLELTRGCVTLWCRLLVAVWSLRLVILVFEECLVLCGGVLLFNVGCWLLGNRYDWSYWFSTLLVVPAFCTVSHCGFLLGLYIRKFFHFLLYGDLSSHILHL